MSRSPLLLFLLLVIGAAAAAGAFSLVDHHPPLPNSGILTVILMAVFFACAGWILVALLRARERSLGRTAAASARTSPVPAARNLEGTVYGLVPGRVYRIAQSFSDCYSNRFEQGELLRFQQRHFLPYHGGHTLVFEERSIYLQEDQNRPILDNFAQYVAPGD